MNYIHPTAIIGPNVEMGDNNYIGPYCVIGYPAEHKEFWPKPEGSGIIGRVIIGSDNVFTGFCTVDAGTEQPTKIGNGVWMLKHSHVGHDSTIYDDTVISCGAKIGGHSYIESGCNIGLNAVLHQWSFIPANVMIGMGAVITKKTEVMPGMKYAGNPARCLGENVKK